MTAPAERTYEIAAALRKIVVDAENDRAAFVKAPTSELDFAFDWTGWLEEGDAIESAEVVVEEREPDTDDDPDESDLIADDVAVDGATVSFWLRDGFTGSRLLVTCSVVTTDGRVDSRSIWTSIEQT